MHEDEWFSNQIFLYECENFDSRRDGWNQTSSCWEKKFEYRDVSLMIALFGLRSLAGQRAGYEALFRNWTIFFWTHKIGPSLDPLRRLPGIIRENQECNEECAQNDPQPEVSTSVNWSPHSVNLRQHSYRSNFNPGTVRKVLKSLFLEKSSYLKLSGHPKIQKSNNDYLVKS